MHLVTQSMIMVIWIVCGIGSAFSFLDYAKDRIDQRQDLHSKKTTMAFGYLFGLVLILIGPPLVVLVATMKILKSIEGDD